MIKPCKFLNDYQGFAYNKKERNQMKIIVSFSGGKDSQACLIQAANKYGADKIEAVFCDTGGNIPKPINILVTRANSLTLN